MGMLSRLLFGLVGLALPGALAAQVNDNRIVYVAPTPSGRPTGAFVFMDNSAACAQLSTCYTKDLSLARKVVQSFIDVGAEMFLIPSLDLADTLILAQAISEQNKSFFTQERWSYEQASSSGTFSCQAFKQDRIDPYHKILIERFPENYRGLHFKDEPTLDEVGNLAAMADCVRANSTTQSLEIYLNLLGLAANTFSSGASLTVHTPKNLGFSSNDASCTLTHSSWLGTHVNSYLAYVKAFTSTVKPTYLAFDFYPFDSAFGACPLAQEVVLTYNLMVIKDTAARYGAEPVMYLQNFASHDNSQYHWVTGSQLRWELGKTTQMGIKRLAYFVSHSFGSYMGLLDAKNEPTSLYTELKTYLTPLAIVDFVALKDLTWVGFNSPTLGLNSNAIVRSSYSPYVNIGVYQDKSVTNRYVLAVSSTDSNVAAPLGNYITFNQGWVSKTEYFNPYTNQWTTITPRTGDTSTNFVWPDLGDYSLMLYRVTY